MPNRRSLKAEPLDELWTFAGFGSLSQQQPLVPAGDRLLGVAGSNIFALDIPGNGKQRFLAKITDRFSGDPYVTSAGGVVYYMDGRKLMARRLNDGSLMSWKPPVIPEVNGLFAIGDRIVAIHIGDNGRTNASAFFAVSGERAFGPIELHDLSPGIVSYGAGAVFFIADGRLHAFNTDFGDARYARSNGGVTNEPLAAHLAPCIADDVVAAAGASLHFFDVVTGAERFTAIAPSVARAAWSSPIAADKGRLIIASNSSEVLAIRTRDGAIEWRTPVEGAGAPALIPGYVVVTANARRTLTTLSLVDGKVDRVMDLPDVAGNLAPAVTNATVFVPGAKGSITARSFGRQHAAYFDGKNAFIDVQPDDVQFDFGVGDFTIEAWVRSSEGGEIVSSYSTLGDADTHGFRLNLGQNGELRIAVVNPRAKSVHAGRTRATNANDGEWHHVALLRRDSALLALLDGKAHDIFLRDDSRTGLDIGGKSALTIGAYRASAADAPQGHFRGLIRELRIWDRALDVATVQNNRHVQLTGNEPRLKGLWSLSEVQPKNGPATQPLNKVDRHGARATFNQAASTPTDLSLDRSGFPYLLHEIETHWPYAGTWAARGELNAVGDVACASNAIAFATNNALYAVRRADGRRLWQIDMPSGVSAPAADGAHFIALTGDSGMIAVDALSGVVQRVESFAGLLKPQATGLVAPAVSGNYVAAGAPHGMLRLLDRSVSPPRVRDIPIGVRIRELKFAGDRLLALCGDSNSQIAIIDPATGTLTRVYVSADAFAYENQWLFCVIDGKLTRTTSSNQIAVQTSIEGRITGMTTNADHDLLVVTTDRGTVHGLELADLTARWKASLPEGPARGSNQVLPPTVDHAGRIYCATSSGTLAVLDPETGARVGLYFNAQPIATAVTAAAATAFFAAAEPDDPRAYRDGALHSVVFGDTMALRLGLKEQGSAGRANTYALIDIKDTDGAKHTLHRMDPARSCIETWINIPTSRENSKRRPGGGILGICPTDNFGINLSVDESGTLHYSARALQNGTWKLLQADVDTGINDGKWHHIAVSRDGDEHVVFYVDGVALRAVTAPVVNDAPPSTTPGIRTYIGAIAGDDLAPVDAFCGMIAEVRVWDTFLTPAEIASRMHVKLRGSEPDLIAYWNFDQCNVVDSGPEQHHGKLVNVGVDPVWWLTDLAFEKPAYPFMTTATVKKPQEPGQSPIYQLTVTVHRADGSGVPAHDVEFKYARRRDSDPERVLFDLNPVKDGISYSIQTGDDGTATIEVASMRADHLPALDVRAAFMPANQRFHVNLMLNQQVLAPPAPPSLVVQSKLIQDYTHSSGGAINEDRDRSTWRTVIRAVNSDGSLRSGEPISLWAEAQLDLEVGNRSYRVNRENSAELLTDDTGELVIVFDADALSATTLIARAGFMHRNDRIHIAPDQELHRQLSDADGSQLTQKRATRWKPGMKEGDGEALLSGDLATQADKIAGAVSTVMSAAKPADTETPAPRGMLRRGMLRAAEDASDTMRQPALDPGGDRVVTLRSMSNAPRRPVLDSRALGNALDGNAGFVFESVKDDRGRKSVRFDMLATQADVDAEIGELTRKRVVLRGFFGDLWDVVVDTATTVYDGAVKIVVTVAEAVEVAVTKLVDGVLDVVKVVVDSVVEAVNAVASFFEQIGVMIMKVIEFLRALFDWGAILDAKDIIKSTMLISIDIARDSLRAERIEKAFRPLLAAVGRPIQPGGKSLNGISASGGEAKSPAMDESRGVQGQMVMQKMRDNPVSPNGTVSAAPAIKTAETAADLFDRLPAVLTGIIDLSPENLVARLLSLIQDSVEAAIGLFIRELATVAEIAGQLTEWLLKILKMEIRIPFLSELYRWITGNELSLLDLMCLAIAVPVHVAHLAVNALHGRIATFADDNRTLVARLEAARDGKPWPPRVSKPQEARMLRDGHAAPPHMDTMVEPYIIGLRVINIFAGYGSDSMFATAVSIGGIGAAEQATARVRGIVKLLKGMTGICAAVLMTYYTQAEFDNRLEKGVKPETWSAIKPFWADMKWAILGVQVAGDLITLGGGGWQAFKPPEPTRPVDGVIPADSLDKKEHGVALYARYACVIAAIARATLMSLSAYHLHENHEDENLIIQNYLFGARDITNALSRAPWYMFTQTGANNAIQAYGTEAAGARYRKVATARAVLQGISLATHTVAIYPFATRP